MARNRFFFFNIITSRASQNKLDEGSFTNIYLDYFVLVHLISRPHWLEIIAFMGVHFLIIRVAFLEREAQLILCVELNLQRENTTLRYIITQLPKRTTHNPRMQALITAIVQALG